MHAEADGVRRRLADAGFTLPRAEVTKFDYLPVTFHDRVAYLAGQIPKQGDLLLHQGRVGGAVTFEQARESTRLAMGQALAWVDAACGGLQNVERVLRMEFFVAVDDGFDGISELADVASGLLAVAYGDAGRHARSVLGVKRLPRQAPVLIQLTLSLKKSVPAPAGVN